MASFISASKAVECGLAIQNAFAEHNAADHHAPIHVRIGFSAGEPVREGEDLFGAAVQMAARVCNDAEPDQVLVASVVRDLCIGKRFSFIDGGERNLKGFEAPVRVYAVGLA